MNPGKQVQALFTWVSQSRNETHVVSQLFLSKLKCRLGLLTTAAPDMYSSAGEVVGNNVGMLLTKVKLMKLGEMLDNTC